MFIFYIINSSSALTLHLNLLGFLIFGIKFHLKEVSEQPGSGFSTLNIMEICDRHHVNLCKQKMLQTDAHITPLSSVLPR